MFTDIMVDIETTGTLPEYNGIIQLAAVKFNLDTREVSPNIFDRALSLAPNRFWDEGTRQFWQKHPGVYRGLMERAELPHKVLSDFYNWVLLDQPDIEGGYRFWAKPVSFDWPFLASYMRQHGMEMPFHYRYACDMNSYIRGLRSNPEHYKLEDEIPFEGEEHNAKWDCFHQIQVLFAAQDRWGVIDGVTVENNQG